MKTILVTGGAGFIGSHLIKSLLKDKKVERVICVDSMDENYPADLRKENLSSIKNSKKFKLYKTDIRDFSSLKNIFKKEKPEVVIHLAAKTDTRTSVTEPLEYETVNIGGTLNLLELSKDFKVKKFIFASSSSVYGNSATPPIKEKDITDFPLSPYGATKKQENYFLLLIHTTTLFLLFVSDFLMFMERGCDQQQFFQNGLKIFLMEKK